MPTYLGHLLHLPWLLPIKFICTKNRIYVLRDWKRGRRWPILKYIFSRNVIAKHFFKHVSAERGNMGLWNPKCNWIRLANAAAVNNSLFVVKKSRKCFKFQLERSLAKFYVGDQSIWP